MLAYPSMLLVSAEEAGIKIPNCESEEWENNLDSIKEEYPYFFVFCMMQLGRSIPDWGNSVRNNAMLIASIPKEKIKIITVEEVLAMGYE
jgi:hypothetical protein